MSKEKGFCDVCSFEIEVNLCCSGHECGCMGLPTEPPICSEECYDKYMNKEYQDKRKEQRELLFPKPILKKRGRDKWDSL